MNNHSFTKYCECGCGKFVKKRFVRGHNNNRKGCHLSAQNKELLSNLLSGKNNPMYGVVPWCKGKTGVYSKEACEKMGAANRGKTRSEETKNKIRIKRALQVISKETKIKIGKASKKRWDDPKHKEKVSKAMKELWKNLTEDEKSRWIKNSYASGSTRPNKPETVILNLLNQLYPGEWKYTGDFSFIINGKCPDFININGQKKIIELFGDYWHKGQNTQDRINTFKPYGYDTLIIWEKELKNLAKIESRISNFAKGVC